MKTKARHAANQIAYPRKTLAICLSALLSFGNVPTFHRNHSPQPICHSSLHQSTTTIRNPLSLHASFPYTISQTNPLILPSTTFQTPILSPAISSRPQQTLTPIPHQSTRTVYHLLSRDLLPDCEKNRLCRSIPSIALGDCAQDETVDRAQRQWVVRDKTEVQGGTWKDVVARRVNLSLRRVKNAKLSRCRRKERDSEMSDIYIRNLGVVGWEMQNAKCKRAMHGTVGQRE